MTETSLNLRETVLKISDPVVLGLRESGKLGVWFTPSYCRELSFSAFGKIELVSFSALLSHSVALPI